MKANEYLVLSDCVENGVNRGWERAFKHWDIPMDVMDWLEEHDACIKEHIENAVTIRICEYFKFDEPKED
jgi:hypothetical protein